MWTKKWMTAMRDDAANLGPSIELAWSRLKNRDKKDIARRSSALVTDEGLQLFFFDNEYVIILEDERIIALDGNAPNPFFEAIILHYLVNAKDIEPAGKMISFRVLEGGIIYYDAFHSRTIAPMIDRFGNSPQELLAAGELMKGVPMEMGDVAVTIRIFPRLSVTIVLWEGDDELAPNVNMLFDSTAGYHLPTEDMAALGSIIASQLARNADKLSKS